jgi:hypothetical protein
MGAAGCLRRPAARLDALRSTGQKAAASTSWCGLGGARPVELAGAVELAAFSLSVLALLAGLLAGS